MANQRDTFAKRRREQELQQRARDKLARRAARRNEAGTTGGPQIAWDEAVRYVESEMPPTEAPGDSKNDDDPPT